MYKGVAVKNIFSVTSLYTVFDERIDETYFYAGERHDFWELVVVAEGEIGITAGENAWIAKCGQAVIHPPMEFHRLWYAEKPCRIIIFSFGAEFLPAEAKGCYDVADLSLPEDLLRQARRCFRMEGICVGNFSSQDMTTQILLKRWELFLLELISKINRSKQESRSRTAINYAVILQVLEKNVHKNLSIAQIADLCGMSEISAKQTFSRYAGMGIMNYFSRLKIERAVEMLRNGSTVQDISEALGFSSPNYFSTVFKRIKGKPPTAYK